MENPVERIIAMTKWSVDWEGLSHRRSTPFRYMSGFHIRPKGVKKPYNPILGEVFRCRWEHHYSGHPGRYSHATQRPPKREQFAPST